MNTLILNKRLNAILDWLPISSGVVAFLFFRTPLGLLFALVAGVVVLEFCAWIRAQLRGRLAYHLWSSYLNPGYTGPVKFPTTKEIGRRIIDWFEVGMGGPEYELWLLDDGSIIDYVYRGWSVTPDKRFLSGMTDAGNHSRCIVYNQEEHVVYRTRQDDAKLPLDQSPNHWGQYASTSKIKGVTSQLETILSNADREQLIFYRGLWLAQSYQSKCHLPRLERRFTDELRLEAILECPEDLRTVDDPLNFLEYPVYRLILNGEETNLWCYGLNSACVSNEGDCLIVGGMIVDEAMKTISGRWHIWRKGRGWISIESKVQRKFGGYLGSLTAIETVHFDSVVFQYKLSEPGTRRVFVQSAWQLIPIKLVVYNQTATLNLPR